MRRSCESEREENAKSDRDWTRKYQIVGIYWWSIATDHDSQLFRWNFRDFMQFCINADELRVINLNL